MAPSDPAARHRAFAATFGDRVAGTTDWDAPTPVAEWKARDVVGHLVEWFPPFLAAGAAVDLPPGPDVAEDPVAAWRHQSEAVQAVLDDPASAARTFELAPHVPATPLPEAIDRFYSADVFMHTWDLARSGGQDDRLDPDECAALLAGMEPVDEMLRASGQYGPRVDVDVDADVVDRLMAFVGRDPRWRPPGRG